MDREETGAGPRATRLRVRVTAFGVAVVALGMLLWARFLIITNYQRTAYAQPVEAPAPKAGAQHAGAEVDAGGR